MENKALKIVKNYIRQTADVDTNKVFIVWSCYILGNRKYMIGLEDSDLYFEVTYNYNKNEWYLDVYNKIANQCIF